MISKSKKNAHTARGSEEPSPNESYFISVVTACKSNFSHTAVHTTWSISDRKSQFLQASIIRFVEKIHVKYPPIGGIKG